MRTRYGVAPWIDNFPAKRRPDYPRLRGEHTAQVVIIGGGMTGCATAYACVIAGLQPVLIEAERLAQGGSTGRSAGLLLPEPGPPFRNVVNAYGLRAARRMFNAWRHAALDGAALLRRLSIPCGLEPRDSLLVAYRDEERDLDREYGARHAVGIEGTRLTPKQVKALSALDSSGAIRLRDGFALDPYRACLGIASAAAKRGAILFERTRVQKVRFSRRNVEVHVDGGVVRAQTAIVATGTATEEFKPLRRHFKRRETYLVLSEPMPAAVRRQVGDRTVSLRSWRSPGRRVCWTRDDRMLVIGGDQDETPARKRDAVLVQRTGQLMYEALTMYPTISGLRPQYGWDARYGETADGLMYIGPHRNYPRHLFALGGHADSLSGAFLAARILTRAVRGVPEKGDDVFGWTR